MDLAFFNAYRGNVRATPLIGMARPMAYVRLHDRVKQLEDELERLRDYVGMPKAAAEPEDDFDGEENAPTAHYFIISYGLKVPADSDRKPQKALYLCPFGPNGQPIWKYTKEKALLFKSKSEARRHIDLRPPHGGYSSPLIQQVEG